MASLLSLPDEILEKIFKDIIDETWMECEHYRSLFFTCVRMRKILVNYFYIEYYYFSIEHSLLPWEVRDVVDLKKKMKMTCDNDGKLTLYYKY
jgi:hypothetical protein